MIHMIQELFGQTLSSGLRRSGGCFVDRMAALAAK
jgi:hypothetical protein